MRRSFLLLAVLIAAAAAGCKSDGTAAELGEIAIVLDPTGASVQAGVTGLPVTATLTRSGGFTGEVQFAVTGSPAGVTAVVSDESTVGPVTTATVTLSIGAAVPAASYTLVVTGTGTGVTPATANFALTVTTPVVR